MLYSTHNVFNARSSPLQRHYDLTNHNAFFFIFPSNKLKYMRPGVGDSQERFVYIKEERNSLVPCLHTITLKQILCQSKKTLEILLTSS